MNSIEPLEGNDIEHGLNASGPSDGISRGEEGAPSASISNADEPGAIIKRETTALLVLRGVLLSFLVCAAVSVSIGTYCVVLRLEEKAFINEFNDLAQIVINTFYKSTRRKLFHGNLISTAFTSYFERSQLTYPNLTLPDFFILAYGARVMTNATAVTFSPILDSRTSLETWEAFATSASDDHPHPLDNSVDVDQMIALGRTVEAGIYSMSEDGKPIDYIGPGPYLPIWLNSVSSNVTATRMYNQLASKSRRSALKELIAMNKSTYSEILQDESYEFPTNRSSLTSPRSILYTPVFDGFAPNRKLVGVVGLEFEWTNFLDYSFTEKSSCMHIILESTDGQTATFRMRRDGSVKFVGEGDLHDVEQEQNVFESTFDEIHEIFQTGPLLWDHDVARQDLAKNHSRYYRIKVYPSNDFTRVRFTQVPIYFALSVAGVFLFTSGIFVLYDRLVERRQKLTMKSAVRSTNVLNSLYPPNVRVRLFQDEHNENKHAQKGRATMEPSPRSSGGPNSDITNRTRAFFQTVFPRGTRSKLKSVLDSSQRSEGLNEDDLNGTSPIADLFPSTTVLFADIAGFTAWSSEREPAQVFQLLETLYRKFDRLAQSHGVFKVETIGDCYVAVTGLPEPVKDHAVVMCRFALDIRSTMRDTCCKLQSILGPGTADLCLRIGLHSGPVTAGVLRGEKSRFQLFGDTVNTASRIESHSLPNRIQISESTARLLAVANKSHWFVARSSKIEAKGKGTLQTYWLCSRYEETSSTDEDVDVDVDVAMMPHHDIFSAEPLTTCTVSSYSDDSLLDSTHTNSALVDSQIDSDCGTSRLIEWNVDVLASSLLKVVAGRGHQPTRRKGRLNSTDVVTESPEGIPIDELTDIIELPPFSDHVGKDCTEPVALDDEVRQQLYQFVSRIAERYKDLPFHNLQHALHVTMSASKLMNRIVTMEPMKFNQSESSRHNVTNPMKVIHDSTFGISSDPLAQFAIVFSALIHDVDHSGLTNCQLVHEGADVALTYNGKSVAEQNSIQVAWSILLEPQFDKLCEVIFPTPSERKRFRQLVVAIVLATDIMDSKLQDLRKNRWQKAFLDNQSTIVFEESMNRKATIVIEHIIQASDVAHTMQHWHVYSKWNARLFEEMYLAYLGGHDDDDPSEGWYESEISFFDHYVIPLAKKLKECGVFGVSSDEYLGFALENRLEWEVKGRDIVDAMTANVRAKWGTKKHPQLGNA